MATPTLFEFPRQPDAARRAPVAPTRSAGNPAAVRVAHIHASDGIYGAERWTLTLLRYHDPARVTPLLITLGARAQSADLANAAAAAGIEVHHINAPGKLSPAMVNGVRRVLKDRRVDIVHTHEFKSDVVGFLASRALPIKRVATTHGWCAQEGARIRLYEALSRVFLRRFSRVYPVSPAQQRDLLTNYRFDEPRVRLLLNAVDIRMFDACFRARQPRARRDPLRILYAGRLSTMKGVLTLIEGFARAQIAPAPTLVLAGDGPLRSEAEALAGRLNVASRVQFVPPVPDIRLLLSTSDVVVLPSLSEGIPRIIMEAFAAGLPAIGTAIPGILQLIDDGETGLTVPTGDAHAIARALELLAADPQRAHAMALNARRRVETRFSADRLRRELEDDYDRLLAPEPAVRG
jgi:glycosyltransferase involved in cell wall biosynthesis